MRVFSSIALAVVGALSAAAVVGVVGVAGDAGVVGVQTTAATGGVALDATVSAHQGTKTTSVTSPSFSTTQANDLVVAFVGADGPSPGVQSISAVAGGGLTWQLARRTDTQAGTAEIWTAPAPAVLKNVTVKATYPGLLHELVNRGGVQRREADDRRHRHRQCPQRRPHGDPDHHADRLLGVGRRQRLGRPDRSDRRHRPDQGRRDLASAGDTFWVQRQTSPGTAAPGTPVTINDTAPTGDRWNLSTVEILPANTDITAPTAPSGLSASTPGAGRATLSWTAATDAVGVTAYDVYRSTTAGFTPSAATLVRSLGAVTGYDDTGLALGTYYYVIRARDAAGNVSPSSNQASVVLADTTAPHEPTALTATVANAKVTLAWTASTDAVGVTGYSVYRSTTAGFTPDASSLLGTATTAGYVDMSVPAGT